MRCDLTDTQTYTHTESVDSICRDGASHNHRVGRLYYVGMVPTRSLSLNKSNGTELPNEDVLSLFRQTTCSASASIQFNTLKVRKIYSYSEFRTFVKPRLFIIFFFFFFFLLQFKWPTAKLGLVIALTLS